MANRFLGIGGRDYEANLAKELNLDEDGKVRFSGIKGEIFRENITLERGGAANHHFEVDYNYRILVRVHDGLDSIWEVSELPSEMNWPYQGRRTLIKSDGTNITLGNGSRGAGYSNVVSPITTNSYLHFEHSSDSPNETMTYSIMIFKYPFSTGFSEPINKKIKTLGTKAFEIDRSGELDANESLTVFQTEKPTSLDYLEFATDSSSGQILIRTLLNGEWKSIGSINNKGSGRSVFTPQNILDNNSSLWSINHYDDSFKFSLRRKLDFPEGLQVVLRNRSSEEVINIGCVGYGREFE